MTLQLAGASLGFFAVGLLGLAMLLGGILRLQRGANHDPYLGGVLGTLGVLFIAIGFIGPYLGLGS